jgi:hypothetical protein
MPVHDVAMDPAGGLPLPPVRVDAVVVIRPLAAPGGVAVVVTVPAGHSGPVAVWEGKL